MTVLILASPSVMICAGGILRWSHVEPDGHWTSLSPDLALDFLMLGAMTSPLLAQNLTHIHRQSLTERRRRATGLFVLGYVAVWTGALIVLRAVSGALVEAMRSDLAALAMALGLGILWQGTPLKALAVRGCHRTPALRTFGVQAEFGSLTYGLKSAAWCVGACWAWMLAPFVLAGQHLWLMAGAFGIMLAERYGRPQQVRIRPGWLGIGAGVTACSVLLMSISLS
jgi:predicted metal-binding membrane protein